jgi:hypothetical protein
MLHRQRLGYFIPEPGRVGFGSLLAERQNVYLYRRLGGAEDAGKICGYTRSEALLLHI